MIPSAMSKRDPLMDTVSLIACLSEIHRAQCQSKPLEKFVGGVTAHIDCLQCSERAAVVAVG